MTFPPAAAIVPSNYPLTFTKIHACQLNFFPIVVHTQSVSVTCSAKFAMIEHFSDPIKRKAILNYTKDKLWRFIPGSIKDFPWKKAESVAMHKLLVLGKETLKMSMLACFAFGFLSDMSYSISRNKELVIPFGLFFGILLTKYFDEIAQQLLNEDKDGHVTWRLLIGVSCFFVIVKLLSTYILGRNDFLVHAANGGFMQLVWNWKNSAKHDGENSLSQDVPTAVNADN